ncbi:MAG: hypothetical protein Q8J68_02795 [Methanolobus sp.]|uniref:hypothetical protein n=1 Tax=Methanolobus sp. TaxID=1874737 RepID=UPI002730823E|nr:hypothetical protein [Methanolobus sp.]MDP2216200.1 hypothetical protein [Methanolobus sp.]
MLPEVYKTIIRKLHKKSAEEEVNWHTTSDGSTYIVYFKTFSLSIDRYHMEFRDAPGIAVRILNMEGDEVDSFFEYDSDDDWQLLNELYEFARRKALRIDEAIRSIDSELDRIGFVGRGDNPAGEKFDDIPF